MQIEFDAAKRAATLKARGLDMARAGELFSGATLTVEDDRRNYGEDRFITVGFLDVSMVVVVWTPRKVGARIISMRRQMIENKDSIEEDFDPDTAPDLSRDGWPEKFANMAVRRGRPPVARPKVSTTIRLSQDVIDHFRADGKGWQTRIDEALREWIRSA